MLNRLILKVTKFQLPPPKRLGTVVKNIFGGTDFVLILLIQYIAHYRVSKVIRKHTKLNHNHFNCFSNDTLN